MNKIIFFLLLAVCLASAGAAESYKYGILPSASQEARQAYVRAAYQDWLGRYITTEGCPAGAFRVHREAAFDYDTVSEGIGWGMLIAVLLDKQDPASQKYFNGFWKYQSFYLNKQGLMAWKIDRSGKKLEDESATEADENMAMALFYAHKQWGSSGEVNYLEEARTLIRQIMSFEVEKETFVLKLGANWGGYRITDPTYFDNAFYKIWSEYDQNWLKVAERSNKIYDYFYDHYSTGLFPDWCAGDGSAAYLSYNYTYDACQTPLKIGLDYLWNGQGGKYLEKISNWISQKTAGKPERIVDGYSLDGKETGKYNNAAFVGPFCVAAMVSPKFQPWLDTLYPYLVGMDTGGRWGYYPDTLRLVSLIILSGQMPNLWEKPIENPELLEHG